MAWWEPTTGSFTAVAAYQAKGAASMAASLVNLNDPGTNDLSDATTPPSFDATTGWTFTAASNHRLTSNASVSNKPATYIVRIKPSGTSGYRTIIGASTASSAGGLSFDLTVTTNIMRAVKQDVALIGTSSSAPADATDAVVALTYDGSGNYEFFIDGASAGSGTNNQTLTASRTLMLGRQGSGQSYNGAILAVAIYSSVLDATQVAEISSNMAALTVATVYEQAVAGTLTSAGTLVKRTNKPLAGTLTSAGAVVKSTARALAGTLTSAGALTKRTGKVLAGVLTSSGTLATVFVAAAQGLIDLTARARSFALQARERVFALTARSRE